MTPDDYIAAARVPHTVQPQEFGLWQIERITADHIDDERKIIGLGRCLVGFNDYTLLRRTTLATVQKGPGEIVMEDSKVELQRHLPIWMAARGRVLVTGLGLGCVVRGLLANPEVTRVDVVEIDRGICRVIWPEFAGEHRAALYRGDALTVEWPRATRWDFAWHDIWSDEAIGKPHLQHLHARLIAKYRPRTGRQGAWAFPRSVARAIARRTGMALVGAPAR